MGILYLFDRGSAQAEFRAEIKEQLASFEEGYHQRDTSIQDSYMEQLFSMENILILGIMPGEIYLAYEEAADMVNTIGFLRPYC